MSEHWIAARQAKAIVRSVGTLCERLHAGLVKSRAALFISDEQSLRASALPTQFWWAEGHEALEQNWEAGDFSTWLHHETHLKAYGVEMALSGVLEMLPFDQRAITARRLSVAGDNAWLSAKAARQFAYNDAGANPAKAGSAIVAQAQLGFITAKAVTAFSFRGHSSEIAPEWEEREWDVPTWFWENFTSSGSSSQDWDLGTFSGKGISPSGLRYVTLRDVRFLKASLDALLPTPATPIALPAKPGGRPPAAFADDLMCAIWASAYRGDLKPTRQADVERAIKNWAVTQGHELGDTSAREKARKIWTAMQEEVENPGV